jgi:acylphosphatase
LKKLKITVKGIVQGVGYRYYCFKNAGSLGLKGYAKNLIDGNVEIMVEGDKGLLEEYILLLKVGPRWSKVTSVIVEELPYRGEYKDFSVY